ncbi:MAG: N-acetylmuramoyl-L-alanine amidase [Minwuia sp.]|nr:N-acetylmuramoyl-L-alanine amidase [Minwuia sp.]
MRIIDRPSPNHDSRNGAPVDMLVLHYTDVADASVALDMLTDPVRKVSAHYLLDVDGQVSRLVAEDRRAWHAGVAVWQGVSDINACSIGIEIQNTGHSGASGGAVQPFPDAQIDALIALIDHIRQRHSIPNRRVLGHSDVAPGRKQDPGAHFPWARLAAAGIGIWPDGDVWRTVADGEVTLVAQIQRSLATIGYGIAVDGVAGPQTQAVVAAFQRHFRPAQVSGTADADTVARIGVIEGLISG